MYYLLQYLDQWIKITLMLHGTTNLVKSDEKLLRMNLAKVWITNWWWETKSEVIRNTFLIRLSEEYGCISLILISQEKVRSILAVCSSSLIWKLSEWGLILSSNRNRNFKKITHAPQAKTSVCPFRKFDLAVKENLSRISACQLFISIIDVGLHWILHPKSFIMSLWNLWVWSQLWKSPPLERRTCLHGSVSVDYPCHLPSNPPPNPSDCSHTGWIFQQRFSPRSHKYSNFLFGYT